MNINTEKDFFLFDEGYPIHTWYPLFAECEVNESLENAYSNLDICSIKNRALYFHIPFCEEKFCSFCSFNRKLKESDQEVENYVEALIKEIKTKSKYSNITQIPITAIFFGGGTPSVLTSDQILKIGKTIHENFNLKNLKEFSFENNICSVTEEKLIALLEIGVTHVRMGIQTFNQKYREYFNLRPSLEDIYAKVELVKKYFNNICIDIIYGINGQSLGEFIMDVHNACKLGTRLIDFYPLTQPKGNMQLHKLFTDKGLIPKTELEIIGLKTLLLKITKDYGYIPHNGHGFVREDSLCGLDNEDITRQYAFEYHKCVMGYDDGDVVGFGAGAQSGYKNYIVINEPNVAKYIESINHGKLQGIIGKTNKESNLSRGIISHLPYFGYCEKNRIDFSELPEEVIFLLNKLINAGIIEETELEYKLPIKSWAWDNVIMYYLSPIKAKKELDACFQRNLPDNYYKIYE